VQTLARLAGGLLSNPNILVTGVPGAGKSATIKALALRLMYSGVRAFARYGGVTSARP
jgi:putative protein kinase ArgK-like GTPase of G3E family